MLLYRHPIWPVWSSWNRVGVYMQGQETLVSSIRDNDMDMVEADGRRCRCHCDPSRTNCIG
jgi:hypothetical protein